MKGSELKDCELFYKNILSMMDTVQKCIITFESDGSEDIYGRKIMEGLIKQKNIINECILLWKNKPIFYKFKLNNLVEKSYNINIERDELISKRGNQINIER